MVTPQGPWQRGEIIDLPAGEKKEPCAWRRVLRNGENTIEVVYLSGFGEYLRGYLRHETALFAVRRPSEVIPSQDIWDSRRAEARYFTAALAFHAWNLRIERAVLQRRNDAYRRRFGHFPGD